MTQNIIIAIIAALGGSGITSILVAIMKRRWKKQDDAEKITPKRIDNLELKVDALVRCNKVMAVDRIRYLGLCYINTEGVTLEEKETLHEMHEAYKDLGGNGHLDTVMKEVDKLKIVASRFKKSNSNQNNNTNGGNEK